jgi:hypothetical protein
MAHPHIKVPLAEFTARIQRTKNRLVAIPANVQQRLALARQANNHLILASIRRHGGGRWNHHYFKLTHDNEFAIPADVGGLGGGDEIDVRVRRVIPDTEVTRLVASASGASLLVTLAERPRAGWRRDGSLNLDEHLASEIK